MFFYEEEMKENERGRKSVANNDDNPALDLDHVENQSLSVSRPVPKRLIVIAV